MYDTVHYKRTILLAGQAYTQNPEEGLVLPSLHVQVPSLYGPPHTESPVWYRLIGDLSIL